MSDNKFISRLKGTQTTKSVVEVQNDKLIAPFTNVPNSTDVVGGIIDDKDTSVVVAKSAQNWKLNGSSLVVASSLSGDGADYTGNYDVLGAGLWIDAVYTFPAGNNPVSEIFTPNAKWVLKLCGKNLLTTSGDTIDFTLLVKIGTTNIITKQFTVAEGANAFCRQFDIDFSEGFSSLIKAQGGTNLTLQLLCSDSGASATIYNGMTVLTCLQRKVDGDSVASSTMSFNDIETELENLETALDGKVNINGMSIMTAPLKFMSGSMRGAVGPYLNGVGFWKLDSDANLTQIATLSDSRFIPTTTNAIDLGSSTKKWKDLYLSGKAYVGTINNGADITVPATSGTLALTSDLSSYVLKAGDSLDGTFWLKGYYNLKNSNQTNSLCWHSGNTSNRYAWGLNSDINNVGFQYDSSLRAFMPLIDKAENLGSTSFMWKNVYTPKINNGADISVPTTGGTLALLSDVAFKSTDVTISSATTGDLLQWDGTKWINAAVSASPMTGATASTDGVAGIVPTPHAGDQDKVLKGDGTWGEASTYHPDLFDFKWADHTLNDVQWLRADTFSWQSGSVYEAAYNHLVDDLPAEVPTIELTDFTPYTRYVSGDDSGAAYPYCWRRGTTNRYTASETPSVGDYAHTTSSGGLNVAINAIGSSLPVSDTETISGVTISFYTATDGHKICLADQESNVAAIYTATGVAWYYILDIPNKRFKLPRSKHEHYGDRPVVGNGKSLGLTDGSEEVGMSQSDYSFRHMSASTNGVNVTVGTSVNDNPFTASTKAVGVISDPAKSGMISTPVQDTDQYKYLYFYVGEFTQEAIENTAGLNASLFNGKVDLDFNNTSMIDYVIAKQDPTAGNGYTWYRKYKSGWVEQGGIYDNGSLSDDFSTTVTLPITMADTNYTAIAIASRNTGNAGSRAGYTNVFTQTTTQLGIGYYRSQSNNQMRYLNWRVEGMAA